MMGPLEQFIEAAGLAVAREHATDRRVQMVKEALLGLLRARDWLPPRYRVAAADHYARHLVYRDAHHGFVIVAMVWQPGQGTPIHDHGGEWCVEGVAEGQLTITRFDCLPPVARGVARLAEREVLHAGVGSAGALIPPVDYHRITNGGPHPAISIHVYGHDLRGCHVYLPRPDGQYDEHRRTLEYTTQ